MKGANGTLNATVFVERHRSFISGLISEMFHMWRDALHPPVLSQVSDGLFRVSPHSSPFCHSRWEERKVVAGDTGDKAQFSRHQHISHTNTLRGSGRRDKLLQPMHRVRARDSALSVAQYGPRVPALQLDNHVCLACLPLLNSRIIFIFSTSPL